MELRGIAFLLVYGIHTDYVQAGWVGVQFFFVLSGFLITGILLDMKKSLRPREYFSKSQPAFSADLPSLLLLFIIDVWSGGLAALHCLSTRGHEDIFRAGSLCRALCL